MGIRSCRGCTPICTCNLNRSDAQPDKPLRGGCYEHSVSPACWHVGQERRGGVAGAALLTRMLFCQLLGAVPEGWRASGWGVGQLIQGLCIKLKKVHSDLFVLFWPNCSTSISSKCLLPFTLFYCNFSSKNSWKGFSFFLSFFNLERFNFLSLSSTLQAIVLLLQRDLVSFLLFRVCWLENNSVFILLSEMAPSCIPVTSPVSFSVTYCV